MSNYIFEHPKEAYIDEIRCLRKAFKRRKTKLYIRWILLFKTYLTYIYRKRRYEISKKELAQ